MWTSHSSKFYIILYLILYEYLVWNLIVSWNEWNRIDESSADVNQNPMSQSDRAYRNQSHLRIFENYRYIFTKLNPTSLLGKKLVNFCGYKHHNVLHKHTYTRFQKDTNPRFISIWESSHVNYVRYPGPGENRELKSNLNPEFWILLRASSVTEDPHSSLSSANIILSFLS